MREMARRYASGEKVFAKMRGYPAWPARIEGLADSNPNNMKYHVLFYGTMQRGICKSQELFPYLEHKEKLGKLSRARGYKEALDQIEGVAPIPELVPKIMDEKYRNGINNQIMRSTLQNGSCMRNNINDSTVKINKISKRKENNKKSDIHTSVINNCNEIQNYSSKPPRKCSKIFKSDSMKQKTKAKTYNNVFPHTSTNDSLSFELQNDLVFSLETKQKQQKNADNCREVKLSSNLSPSQKGCKLNKLCDNSSEPGSSTQDSEEQLHSTANMSVSRSGRVIKRKTFYDETQAILPKRKKIQRSKENVCSSPSNQNQKQSNYRTPSHLNQKMQSLSSPLLQKLPFSRVCLEMPKVKKQTARCWLATENCMTRLDSLIRAQLGMTRANPQQCIHFLEDMADLDLKPLMLKKHPEVVETIKRLRRYVGNAGAWNLTEEETKAFEELALQIRLKAEYIFDKFKVLFSVPDNCSFLEVFADSVVEFQTTTQHWPLAKIYALVAEPKIKVTKRLKSSKLSQTSTPSKQSKSPQHLEKQKSSKVQMKTRKQPKIQTKTKGHTTKSSKRRQKAVMM